MTQCDAKGNDCWYTPPKRLPPVYPRDPYVLPGDEATADPSGTVDPGRARIDESRVAQDDGDADKPKKKAKGKKRDLAKKGRR